MAARNAPRAMVPLSVGPSKRGVEHRGIAQDCSTNTFDVSPPKAFHELLPSRSTCCDPKQKAPSLELSVEQQTPHLAQGDNTQRQQRHTDKSKQDPHEYAQAARTAQTQLQHTKPCKSLDVFPVEAPPHTTRPTQDRESMSGAEHDGSDTIGVVAAVSAAWTTTPSRTPHKHGSSTERATADATAARKEAQDQRACTPKNRRQSA